MLFKPEEISVLHQTAIEIVSRYKSAQADLIDILQRIDAVKAYYQFQCTSLFQYAVQELGLSEDTAYNFINVARKAVRVPALKAAIRNGEITISKAKKITSVITEENHKHWLSLAKALPQKKLEREVVKVNPKAATEDKITYITVNRVQLTMGLSEDLLEKFKRAQNIECQRKQKPVDYEGVLEALVEFYLSHKDVLREAQQVARPVYPTELVVKTKSTKTLTPARKHFILRKHNGQCTAINKNGKRCANKRWLHIHHLKPRSQNGSHLPQNLTVLCSGHHRIAHEVNH